MFRDLAIIAPNNILPIRRLETAIEKCHPNQPLELLPAGGIEEAKSIYGEWTRKLISKYRMLVQCPFTIRERASRDASTQEIAACDSVLHELTNVDAKETAPPSRQPTPDSMEALVPAEEGGGRSTFLSEAEAPSRNRPAGTPTRGGTPKKCTPKKMPNRFRDARRKN